MYAKIMPNGIHRGIGILVATLRHDIVRFSDTGCSIAYIIFYVTDKALTNYTGVKYYLSRRIKF